MGIIGLRTLCPSRGVGPTIPMKLVSLLSERRVLPEMTSDTPWDAIGELVDHLISTGHVEPERREDVLKALHAREDQVSTGIGHGVAIPHAYCDRIDEPVAVLGRSHEGIDFEACDNAPVHFVILLLVPKDQPHLHLQTLASIARLFSQCEVRKKLKLANSAGDLLEAVGWGEAQAA
jgi:mannitol/fructose-specific phosphotransferase system IIA component (Ntr-type)